jgi:hypothetical protein
LILVLSALAFRVFAQTPQDVPQSHWAYQAVNDLASKGLIKGYPPTGNFLGGRTMTRYEMASLIQRVLAYVDENYVRKGAVQPSPGGVTKEELDEIRRLVDEFRVELTVIGTDLKKVQDQIGGLQSDVDALKQQGADLRQGLQAAIDAINEQGARINALNDALKTKASTRIGNKGTLTISGLLQVWIQAFKDSPINYTTPSFSQTYLDTFRIRRAEIQFDGTINPKTYWQVMFDLAKLLAVNTNTAGQVTGVNPGSEVLQNAFLGLKINHELALEVGQQKIPMSLEGLRSSRDLLTVERFIFNTLPVNNGRVGDVRDIGGLLRLTSKYADGQVGVFDDGGNRQNNLDDNDQKEVFVHLDVKPVSGLLIGGYQEITGGVNGARVTPRFRSGAEMTWQFGPHTIEAEYAFARDNTPAINSEGGYFLYAYSLSRMWQFVGRVGAWNPNRDLHSPKLVQQFDFLAGVNYYLNGHNSKLQFNWERLNTNGPVADSPTTAFLGPTRDQFLVNFQQAF